MKFFKKTEVLTFDGEAFRQERERRKLGLRRVALEAGCSPAFLSELERGKRTVSDDLAARLIAALAKVQPDGDEA